MTMTLVIIMTMVLTLNICKILILVMVIMGMNVLGQCHLSFDKCCLCKVSYWGGGWGGVVFFWLNIRNGFEEPFNKIQNLNMNLNLNFTINIKLNHKPYPEP